MLCLHLRDTCSTTLLLCGQLKTFFLESPYIVFFLYVVYVETNNQIIFVNNIGTFAFTHT